jgi:hypothetical protein
MRHTLRLVLLTLAVSVIATVAATATPLPAPQDDHFVFIGGYFCDPGFGQYPWWPWPVYRHSYYPLHQDRAVLRVLAVPKTAAVYVDGFYAGIVEDFNGFFQGLPLPPGGHAIVLYLDGYRTIRRNFFFQPGSTVKLEETMMPVSPGETSEPPTLAPPLPPPPEGTFLMPRSPATTPLPDFMP